MENTYQEFTEKLGKLQRNETQMTERQKVIYAAQLKSLKSKIAASGTEIARGFILGSIRILKADPPEKKDECIGRVTAIIDQEVKAGAMKRASNALFHTYDVDKFLEALLPIHNRVWYEGYGPYWCQHCKPYTGTGMSGKPLTFWSDLIEMGWNPEYSIWESEKKISWTLMLPPTMELVAKQYQEEKVRLAEWKAKDSPALQTADGGNSTAGRNAPAVAGTNT